MDIKKIAHLARLHLNENDIPEISEKLQKLMSLTEQFNKIDTNNIEPMFHPLHLTQALREDKISEHNRREEFLALAPETAAGLYLVPQVIE